MATYDWSQRRRRRDSRILLTAAIAVSVITAVPALTASAGETVTIKPSYRQGERLQYSWHLENELSWSPAVKGSDWVKMTTDFDFVLDAKDLTDDGGCLFDLEGNASRASVRVPRGSWGSEPPRPRSATCWERTGPNRAQPRRLPSP